MGNSERAARKPRLRARRIKIRPPRRKLGKVIHLRTWEDVAKYSVYDLSQVSVGELIQELRSRGFRGELYYVGQGAIPEHVRR